MKLIFIHVGKTGGSSGRCMLHPLLTEGSCGKYSNFDYDNQKKNATSTTASSRGEQPQQQQDMTAIFDQTFTVCHMQGCSILVPDSKTTDDGGGRGGGGTNIDDMEKVEKKTTTSNINGNNNNHNNNIQKVHRKGIVGRGIPGE